MEAVSIGDFREAARRRLPHFLFEYIEPPAVRRPLILKGILDPEDARHAAEAGADGIIVSNHGGRQLDGVLLTAAALLAIVEAVSDRLTILADGGVRSGLDVVRLLLLGAKGVLLGRAWAYAWRRMAGAA